MIRCLKAHACSFVAVAALCWLAGCGRPASPAKASLYARLQSQDPSQRIAAAIEAGQRRDHRATPLLVDRLEDEQSDVRMYAILALERITGHRFGYQWYAPAPQREASVQRWRRWLREDQPRQAVATQSGKGQP